MTIAANIGDSAILGFDACFPDSVVGFIPKNELSVKFLNYYFLAIKDSLLAAAPGAAQKNLNVERLGNIMIPLPTIAEQRETVVKLGRVMKQCEQLENLSRAGAAWCAKLRRAVLEEAFS